MKKLVLACLLAFASDAWSADPSITGVMAQLENPWNGKVYVSYKVTGDIAAMAKERGLVTSLKVTATDNDANETYTAANLSGDMSLVAGTHSVVWDMEADGLSLKSSNVVFTVSYEKTPALYCVVDLSAGSSASSYPVTYLAEPPSGGFNTDEYKTTKLVLRRIEPGSFIMGDDQSDESHQVTLTKPFYAAIFEMTQKQYQLVTGSNPSKYTGDKRPVENVSYDMIRGSSSGAQWPSSASVDTSSFMGKFQARTGLAFDLPTEAQWEYACRAGTTSAYNNGGNDESDLKQLGRYSGNASDGKGGYSSNHTTVGSYVANAWDLYDMHGNVWEWCLDWYGTLAYGTDPCGAAEGTRRVPCGGSWKTTVAGCASSSKSNNTSADTDINLGFRLVRTMSCVDSEGSLCSGVSAAVNLARVEPWSLSENLVAHYTFDGNANDASGNGNDGVLHDVTSTADRHGNAADAYHFNGTSSYIEVPDSDSLREVGQTVTVSVWVKPDAWGSDNWISILCKGYNDECRQYGPQINKSCNWILNYYNGKKRNALVMSKTVEMGKWVLVTVTYSPTMISAYLNGELVGSMTPLGNMVKNTEPLYIGLDAPGGDEYFNGDMDEVRIYNRALSAAEVRALANSDNPVAKNIGDDTWIYQYDFNDGMGLVWSGFGDVPSVLNIPDSIDEKPVVQIGSYAFYDSTSLEQVVFPNTIGTLTIGGHALNPSTTVEIGDKEGYEFVGWRNGAGHMLSDPFHSDETVTVTPVWRKIETAVIDGRTWTYAVINGEATIGIGSTAVVPELVGEVEIPAELGGYPVTGIASNAFKNCVGMTSLTISSNVTSVGIGAFDGCSGLTNLVIESEALYTPGLLQTKFDTRFDTTSTLGDTTNAIASVSGAIAAYSKVTAAPWEFADPLTGNVYAWNANKSTFAHVGQMFLEGGKTYVFGMHFDGNACVKVDGQIVVVENDYTGTVSDEILTGMIHIGSYACISSAWYAVDIRLMDGGGNKGPYGNIWTSDFGAGYRDDGSTNAVQSGWSRLLDSGDGSLFRFKGVSFVGCSNLVSVTMPLSLVTTMAAAFPDAYDKLESVTLTGDAAAIPEKAFARCESLKSVTMPAETTGIGTSAFLGCTSLSTITLPKEIGPLALGADVCDAATTVEIESADGYYFGGWTNATGVILSDPFHSPVAVTVSPRWMAAGTEYDEHLIFFEDFEREAMEFELATVGTFPYPASIQTGMGVDGSRGFGFGRSDCNSNAHFNYVNTLTAYFNRRYFITRVEFDEMERYGNTGSVGNIIVNRTGNERLENKDFCRMPTNDKIADTEFRHRDIEIGKMATNISFQVVDITGKSEEFIDNVKIYGRLARQCTVMFDANGGTGTMAGQTILEGDDLTLADNVFVRDGCQFMGWAVLPGVEVAFADGETIRNVGAAVDGTVLYAVWKLCAPDIVPAGTVSFPNASQMVTITSDAADATILYTTDGSDPLTNGLEYKRPFSVYNSCTVRAVAVADGVIRSDETTSVLTRAESLSGAANLYGFTMETGGDAPWTVDADVSHDGVSSVRSGTIGNNGMTYLLASVRKAGTVTFWWRAACEAADEEEGEDGYYDYGAFIVDDVVVARIAGHDGEWHYVSHEIAKGGKHTLKWEYSKDGATSFAPDCVWLDQVQWIPADGSGFTLTTPEPVPYSWLAEYGLGVAEGDFEAAANAASGKADGMGKPLSVWQDYVAGTDPTNAASRLTAMIEMRGDEPIITWEPNLNTNGDIRTYKVHGKENLTDPAWTCPTNSLHRFFRVTVEMP